MLFRSLQSSQSANAIFTQTQQQISNIMMNKDMSWDAKQAAIDQQVSMLQSGLSVAGSVAGVDLGSLLTFDRLGNAGGPTAPSQITPQSIPQVGVPNPNASGMYDNDLTPPPGVLWR